MSAARRFLPTDPKDFLRSIVPIVLLGLGAFQPDTRLIVLILLALGTTVATRRNAPVRWVWAAAVPAAAVLTVQLFQPSTASSFPEFCTTPVNATVTTALVAAVAAVAVVVGLAVALGADRATLFARLPRRGQLTWIPIGLGAGLVLGTFVVPVVLFSRLPTSLLNVEWSTDAIVQAVLYGLGIAIASEVAYRGALIGWSARILGVGPAVVGQALVVALAGLSVGGDALWPVATGGYALLAGLLTVQTRSLAVSGATTFGFATMLYLQGICAG